MMHIEVDEDKDLCTGEKSNHEAEHESYEVNDEDEYNFICHETTFLFDYPDKNVRYCYYFFPL